jgi:hypothetical protein
VGFVPITVAGQRWSYTTFPSRLALCLKVFLHPPLKKAVSSQLSANKNALKKCNLINLLVAER